jgi:hypothetical protein
MIRLLAALCCFLLIGCTPQASNERTVLGGRYTTASFGGSYSVLDETQAQRPRDRWAGVVLVAPTDGTITAQTLRTPIYLKNTMPPRRYGLYPTSLTVLEADDREWMMDILGSFDELGRSIGEIVLMPYRALTFAIAEPYTWSPERPWKRTNRNGASEWANAQPAQMKREDTNETTE